MTIKYINLDNRAVIYITGSDRKTFLQGLVTNDVNNASSDYGIYAVMLNPQGRFLYDFFITELEDKLILDCDKNSSDDLIKKLSFYKLRAKITIGKMEDFAVISLIGDEKLFFLNSGLIHFADPRNNKMGLRAIGPIENLAKFVKENNLISADINFYNYLRINLKIVDNSDLFFDQSLILEYGFENFNAIDYTKGCYVGQEVVARTHYRGVIRKKVFLITIENLAKINLGAEIISEGKKIGVILSSVFYDGKLNALALIKNIDANDQNIDIHKFDLKVENNNITHLSS